MADTTNHAAPAPPPDERPRYSMPGLQELLDADPGPATANTVDRVDEPDWIELRRVPSTGAAHEPQPP